ncbi:MAG: hypothetical protein ACREDF_04565 [Thermoplasmata archaeon]
MPEVTIRYCLPFRYQFKAIQDATDPERIRQGALGSPPGARRHGVYDVEVDGKLVVSLGKSILFPETPELIPKIRARPGGMSSRTRGPKAVYDG